MNAGRTARGDGFRPIAWEEGAVVVLDQKALPLKERYVVCRRYEEVAQAIADLTLRGAPLIGVAAAMGIALGVRGLETRDAGELRRAFADVCRTFAGTRPTARNLFWAIERMEEIFAGALSAAAGTRDLLSTVGDALVCEALRMACEDEAANRAMGAHGQALIDDGDGVLTHCNAGALATAGYGTALGVLRAARDAGKTIHVYVDETRPVLQGARLTAWELSRTGIPATLVTDGMAAWLMRQGRVRKVIVGADRIAGNGDTANKIGTYGLSVLARAHRIPFFVAAPFSTVDRSLKTGREIPIEERDPGEITHIRGRRIAPEGMAAYNPAFDVTPHRFISAIVTERGILRPPYRPVLRG